VTRLAPISALGLAAATTLFAGLAAAQQPPPAPAPLPHAVAPSAEAKPRKPDGWDQRVAVGAGLNLATNADVGGQQPGTSFSFGLVFNAAADLNHGAHEWRNALGLNAGITRNPSVDEFVKTNDALNLESIYLFHVVDVFGPFFRASMSTALFPGRDVRPGKATYQVVDATGVAQGKPITPAGAGCTTDDVGMVAPGCHTSLALGDGFRPLTFKQSLGLFVQPLQMDDHTIELRAAAAAHEVIAKNQLAVADDPTTSTIELHTLQSARQLGPEFAVAGWGTAADRRFTYRASAELMIPLAHNALTSGDTRSAIQLTNVAVEAALNFRFVEWASLDYQLRVVHQPQVLDTFQVQNMLLLTFGPAYASRH
jgi:hypothetical protein